MAVSMLSLPSELIAYIFTYLDDGDVYAARLVNRQVESASLAHFGKRFFRKKGYMITTSSLDVLISIANNEGLGKHVQHVWFNPDCYTFARPPCVRVMEDFDSDEESLKDIGTMQGLLTEVTEKSRLAQYEAWRRCLDDHVQLLYSNDLEQKLTIAFKALPNLRTVGMRRSEDYKPYGWKTLLHTIGADPRELGMIPSEPMSELSRPTQLFVALIRAIAKSEARPQRLYTDAIEVDNIAHTALPLRHIELACSNIKYLELNVIKAKLTTESGRPGHTYDSLSNPEDFGVGVVRLLQAMPKLKEVGLQVFPDMKQRHLVPPKSRDPESWRSSYPFLTISTLVAQVKFDHLKRVKLEKITTTSDTLVEFLSPSAANLNSLKIRNVRLLSSRSEPRPWQEVLTFLATRCASLEYILLSYLMHSDGGITFVEELSPQIQSGTDPLLGHSLQETYAGTPVYFDWDHITVLEIGREDVQAKLAAVKEKHWYHKPLFSYAMDDEVWHTDTSEEEW